MSGPTTDASGRIQKPQQSQNGQAPQPQPPARRGLAQLVETSDFDRALRQALPSQIKADKMARIILTALRTTRDLARCTPESFFSCVMQAAALGLEPNTPNGHCWLIPRKNGRSGGVDCTLIVGYQGMIELALRSGKVDKIWTRVVREGDHFKVKYGLEEDVEHEPSIDPRREQMPITYVYGVAALKTGGKVFEVLSAAQVDARRKRSAAGASGPWQTDYEAMVRKTAVRSLFKWVPKSSEMALVESLEQRVDEGKGQVFDSEVYKHVSVMGINPIYETDAEETPSDVDPETGETLVQAEPGANG